MKKFNKKQFFSVIYIFQLIIALLVVSNPTMIKAAGHVSLYSATSFGVLAGSTITNTGTTSVNGTAGGDIGLHPGDDPTIETFPGQENITYTGEVYMFEEVAQQAKTDLFTAYNDAEDRESTNTIDADLDGLTLSPGVYTSASSISLTGTLYLDGGGDPNAVFIFQAGSTLTTISDSEIILLNGAQPCNVFWQVGSSATLGTDSTFVGHILALQSITAQTNAVIYGSLLSINGAVTLDSNVITNDACTVFGTIVASKEVVGPIGNMILPNFEITITGPDNYVDTKIIPMGGEYVWDDLVMGTYVLSEKFISNEWVASGVGSYVVADETVVQATITNTFTPDIRGSLTINKIVLGDVEGVTLPDFVITITGPNNYSDSRIIEAGTSYTWVDLIPGAYAISESRDGFNNDWEVTGESTVQVLADQAITSTITNEYMVVAVTKIVDTGDTSDWLSYSGLILLGLGLFILRKIK